MINIMIIIINHITTMSDCRVLLKHTSLKFHEHVEYFNIKPSGNINSPLIFSSWVILVRVMVIPESILGTQGTRQESTLDGFQCRVPCTHSFTLRGKSYSTSVSLLKFTFDVIHTRAFTPNNFTHSSWCSCHVRDLFPHSNASFRETLIASGSLDATGSRNAYQLSLASFSPCITIY